MDLKRFIDNRINQSEAALRAELVKAKEELNRQLNDGFTRAERSIENVNQQHQILDQRVAKVQDQTIPS